MNRLRAPLETTLKQTRCYATAKRAGTAVDNKTASKFDRAKELVYGESFKSPLSHNAKKLAKVKTAVPSLEAQDTISRAWALHQRQQRESFQHNMKVRFDAMQQALVELEEASPKLFQAATARQASLAHKHRGPEGILASREGRLNGLFPRQIQIPTERSAPGVKWDAEWTRS